jgi:micrococcal nuclease
MPAAPANNTCYHGRAMKPPHRNVRRVALLALLALLPMALTCGCDGVTDDDDDDSAAVDDDDDTGSTDDDDSADPWYTDPGDLPEGASPCRDPMLVELNYIIDGDTARVLTHTGQSHSVRFIGIDTPEMGYDGEPDECYAAEATDFTEGLLQADRFWLTFDAECYDDYDRLLAYAHVRDGFVQIMILEGGYATTLEVAPNTSFASEFIQAQNVAQAADAGLWSVCD